MKKKWLLLILAAVFFPGILGCSKTEKKPETEETKESETVQEVGADEEKEPTNIWIIGDSLAAEHHDDPAAEGWGAMLQKFIKEDDDVVVRNGAVGGASASRYIQIGMCDMIMDSLIEGDYVIIQFGHNEVWQEDRQTDPYGSSSEEGSFKNILKNDYIKPIIEKGAHPILATSVMSCSYDGNGQLCPMFYEAHAQAMRELAEECEKEGMDVTLVDTYAITEELYRQLDETEAMKFHVDLVHYNDYGAAYAAGIIAEEMKKAGIECFQNIYTLEEVVKGSEELQKTLKKLGVTDVGDK